MELVELRLLPDSWETMLSSAAAQLLLVKEYPELEEQRLPPDSWETQLSSIADGEGWVMSQKLSSIVGLDDGRSTETGKDGKTAVVSKMGGRTAAYPI